MLRIRKFVDGQLVVLALSGRVEADNLPQLESLIKAERSPIVLDLKEVSLIAREVAVVLGRYEHEGIVLRDCPAFIRAWIVKEQDRK